MKKLPFIFIMFIILSCSKSDENITNPNSDTRINLPNWLTGKYKADKLFTQSPYPYSQPYSIEFKSGNDMIIKSTANSSEESLQKKIDDLVSSGKLISVEESYDTTSPDYYVIVIKYKPIPPRTSDEIMYFKILNTPLATPGKKISIIYGASGTYSTEDQSYYTLQ
jgi:hypothetical protein